MAGSIRGKIVHRFALVLAVGILCDSQASAMLSAQSTRVNDIVGDWVLVRSRLVGPASLGGIVSIRHEADRMTIVRSTGPDSDVSWSCALDGSECTNAHLDGMSPTASRVLVSDSKIVILTRATDGNHQTVELRRVLVRNEAGELVIETTSSPDNRFGGTSVYRPRSR